MNDQLYNSSAEALGFYKAGQCRQMVYYLLSQEAKWGLKRNPFDIYTLLPIHHIAVGQKVYYSTDFRVMEVDWRTGKQQEIFQTDHSICHMVLYEPYLALGSYQGTVTMWNVEQRQLVSRLESTLGRVTAMIFKETFLFVGTFTGWISQYDFMSGERIDSEDNQSPICGIGSNEGQDLLVFKESGIGRVGLSFSPYLPNRCVFYSGNDVDVEYAHLKEYRWGHTYAHSVITAVNDTHMAVKQPYELWLYSFLRHQVKLVQQYSMPFGDFRLIMTDTVLIAYNDNHIVLFDISI